MASVTWRDGVHLTGTPLWCDARRRRDICFVSSADRVGRTGHGQLIASPLTLALLGASGALLGGGHLGVPRHRRFTLGTVRLELIASGRGPGGAALFVDITGKTVLYAGAIRTHAIAAAGVEAAEVRACDALVVAAPYGKPEHAFAPLAQLIDDTLAWAAAELAAGRRPVLLVETALDGLEVAMCLAHAGIAIAGARPIREAAQRASTLDAVALATAKLQIAAPGKEPRAIVWLARDASGLAKALGEHPHTSRAAWPNAAGRAELLAWIESANAREVFVTGACAEDIAAALGPRARVIGPPTQMTLFEALP
jgi:putative mRNA 3-end processing factor